jgi:Domain of unknown function (DUF4365)
VEEKRGTRRREILTSYSECVATHRILVVLFLPREDLKWLVHDVESLVIRKCAYWVSLRGAPDPTNRRGETIKIPKVQSFSPENLKKIMTQLSRKKVLTYENL